MTHTNWPPRKPGRFKEIEGASTLKSACLVGDFRGKGTTSIACHAKSKSNWQVMSLDIANAQLVVEEWPGPAMSAQCLLLDVNADGRTDLACQSDDESGNWSVSVSSGQAFVTTMWDGGPIGGIEFTGGLFWQRRFVAYGQASCFAGDFDGDRRSDIACYRNQHRQWHIGYSTGAGWRTEVISGHAPIGANMPSIVLNQNPSLDRFMLSKKCLALDLDGDQRTDISCNTGGTTWNVLLFELGSPRAVEWKDGPPETYGDHCALGDFNGDSKIDFLCNPDKSAAWKLLLSTGSGWKLEQVSWLDLAGREVKNACFSRESGFQKTEIVCSRTDGVYERIRSAGLFPNLLRELKGGLGGKTVVDYASSAETLNSVMPALPVVSGLTLDNGVGLSFTNRYEYAHGLFHYGDRSFRGFRDVIVNRDGHPQFAGAKTRRVFYQGSLGISGKDEPLGAVPYLRGRESRREVQDETGALLTRQKYFYSRPASAPYHSYLNRVETETCVGGSCVLAQVDDIVANADGEIVSESRSYKTPLAPPGRLIEREYTRSVDGRVRGLVTRERVLSLDKAQVFSDMSYGYDSTNNCAGGAGLTPPTLGLLSRVERVSASGNVVVEFAHDELGNVSCTRDARGAVNSNEFDPATGFLTKSENALGHRTEFVYFRNSPDEVGLFGNVKKVTGADGISIRTEYDAFRRPAAVYANEAASPFRKSDYSDIGDPTRQKLVRSDPDGIAEVIRFDGGGQTISTLSVLTTALNSAQSESWMPGGIRLSTNLSSVDGTLQGQTRYFYDARGAVSKVQLPDGRETLTCRVGLAELVVADGRLVLGRLRSPQGDVVEIVSFLDLAATDCSAAGSLVTGNLEISSPHIVTRRRIVRDGLNRVERVVDDGVQVLHRLYDDAGRLQTEVDANRGRTTYRYDKAGQQLEKRHSSGRSAQTFYDLLGRPKLVKTTSGNQQEEIALEYDNSGARSTGKLTRVKTPNLSEDLTYDDMGRLSTLVVTYKHARSSPLTLARTYDELGRTKSIRYPDGRLVSYVYDRKFLERLELDGGPMAHFSDPNAFGEWRKAVYGNGVTRDRDFSGPSSARCVTPGGYICSESLRAPGGALIGETSYKFIGGRLVQLDEHRPGFKNVSNRYFYDAAGRFSAHATRSTAAGWSERPLPRVSLVGLPAQTVAAEYVASEPGATFLSAFEYDKRGNLVWSLANGAHRYSAPTDQVPDAIRAISGFELQYDSGGRATRALDLTLDYDAAGRISRTKSAAAETVFTYGGSGELRRFRTGNTDRLMVGGFSECATASECRNAVSVGGEVIGYLDRGSTFFTHRDQVGSVLEVTDRKGELSARYSFSPYGESSMSVEGTAAFRSFAGGQPVPGSSAYRMGSRIYVPRAMRFVSPDPIPIWNADVSSSNPYAYAFNRPTYYTDPNGEFPWAIVAAAALIGGIQAAQHGDNILEGALRGAVFGVFVAGGYAVIAATPGITAFGQGAVMAYSGAFGGVAQTTIWGGDPSQAALGGAISALGGHLLGGYNVEVFGNANGFAGTANYVATAAAKGAGLSAMYAAATGRDIGESALQGAKSGAIGATATSAVHHVAAATVSRSLPKWDSNYKVWKYDMSSSSLASKWHGFSLGNVVSSAGFDRPIGSMPGKTVLDHEASHTWKQSTALGPGWGYLGSHAVAMLGSLIFSSEQPHTHSANVLENDDGWIDVPYD